MEDTNDFLPKGYEAPVAGGAYMKFQEGDNVFRILSSAIVGYEYWTNDNKPVRSKVPFEETPNCKQKDGKNVKPKHFWAFVVYNYTTKNIELLQITQAGIQGDITNLINDEDWGTPKNYDIKVNRTGSGIETEYTLSPKPKKELDPEIAAKYAEMDIKLENIYTGENPFE